MSAQSPGEAGRRSGFWLPPWAWVAIGLALLLIALYRVSLPQRLPGAVVIDRASVTLPADPVFAPQTRALPHVLDDESPAWWRRVDYELPWPEQGVEAAGDDRRLALLVPRAGMGMRVVLNGQEIYRFGWDAPDGRTVNATWLPHYVVLPPALLKQPLTDNRLVIQIQARVLERSGLWPVQLGDADVVFHRYQSLHFWQVTATSAMALVSVLVALLAWALWRSLRERLFLLMGLASGAHAIRMLLSVVTDLPIPYELYFWVHRVAFSFYAGFFILTIEALFGGRLRWVRVCAWGLIVAAPAWMLGVLWAEEYDLYRIWAGGMALLAGVGLLWAVVDSIRQRAFTDDRRIVAVVAAFMFITALRDFLVVQLNFPGDADLRWTSIGGFALMLTMGWVLVDRATAWARSVHRLNDTLAQTVAQREAELREAFDRLRRAERQQVIERERQRLMRDMHDGLGSQLVQALNLVRRPDVVLNRASIEPLLTQALDELRLTLDSLEPMEGDLPAVLGTLRRRLGPALEAAGIELRWEVQDVPALPALDSRGVLHLFRCLQEILANVVKHARARRVTVSTWRRDDQVILTIEDDGIGLPPPEQRPARGKGLRNVLTRAAKLGASVRFYDAHPGTGIEFSFTLQPGAAVRDSGWSHTHV